VTFLGSNFVEQGQRAAEWLAKTTNGTATIVELSGTPGSSVAADRARGFREEMASTRGCAWSRRRRATSRARRGSR
jgi:ribose transport system substrate-binding protein